LGNLYSLGKEERLKSSLRIQELLKNGQSFSVFPLKIYWDTSPSGQEYPVRVAISVPKKKIRRAVDRNLMKRRIREAYRLNKEIIYQPLKNREMNISLLILFLSDEFLTFEKLEPAMKKLLGKLVKSLPE
jgi:ribonuclease P protein component